MRVRGGVTEVQVDEYEELRDADGELVRDDAGAPLFGNELQGDTVETKIWRPLKLGEEHAPVELGNGVALRHMRTSRGDPAAEAPQLHRRGARGVVPAPDEELARYEGILPEGSYGHTTEVREQVLVYGEQLSVTLYYVPYAPTAAAHAKLRAALLEREAAPPARRADFSKALAAMDAAVDSRRSRGAGRQRQRRR